MFLGDVTSQGVVGTFGNAFSFSGTSSPVTINTGAGVVNGIPFLMDASKTLAVTTPSTGTTGYLVVLQANYSAQTVRCVLHGNTDGTAAIPAPTQVAGTTWEIPLWSFTITTGGVISAPTDKRKFISPGIASFYDTGSTSPTTSALIINSDNTNNLSPGTYTITFPKPYPVGSVPVVVATAVAISGGQANDANISITNITNTGFTFNNSAAAGIFIRLHYIAIARQ